MTPRHNEAARTEKYPRVTPSELDAEGLALRAAILDGARRTLPGQLPIEATDGSLNGPFGVFLFAPAVGHPLQELGAALRTSASLTPRERELATLGVAAELRSEYELSVHVPTALASGVSRSDIDAVLCGKSLSARREQLLVEFARANARVTAPRDEFDLLAGEFGRQAVVEILALVAYYRGLASMLELLRVEVEAPIHTPLAGSLANRPACGAHFDADLAQLIEEREITRLLMSIASCVDRFDFDGLAMLYAEDGELVTPWGSHRGRSGLAEYVGKDIGVFRALHHVSAGHQIDVIPGEDTARARMTLLATHVTDDSGTAFSTTGGHYEIALTREYGSWKLARVQIVPAWSFNTGEVKDGDLV